MSASSGHEPLGINVGRVGLLAGITVAGFLLALVASLLLWIFWHRSTRDAAVPPARQALASSAPVALDVLRARQRQMLTSYGWINRGGGIARIPVQRAMVLLAERNRNDKTTAPESDQ